MTTTDTGEVIQLGGRASLMDDAGMWRVFKLGAVLLVSACREDGVESAALAYEVEPERVEFGEVGVNAGRSLPVTVRNLSRFEVTVELRADAPFRAPSRETIPAGGERQVAIWFEPRVPGAFEAELRAVAEGASRRIALRGIGTTAVSVCDGVPDGTACEAACLEEGTCVAGECRGTERSCDDGDPCTLDGCDPLLGCTHLPRDCGDSLDPCTVGACDPKVGCTTTPLPDGTRCGLNDCVEAQVCIAGTCTRRPSVEGSACGEPSPCQPDGVCRSGGCERGPRQPLQTAWTFVGRDLGELSVTEIDEYGRLFIGEKSGNGLSVPYTTRITGIDARTGTSLVEFPPVVGWVLWWEMVSVGGRLLVAAGNEALAFDATTGALLWRTDIFAALHTALEPWRGRYPLYGVQTNGFIQRSASRIEVLVDGEGINEYGHVVWLGNWWVELEASTGAVVQYVRLGPGNAAPPLHDGSGTVFVSTVDPQQGASLQAILPTGAVTSLESSTVEEYQLHHARGGRLLAGKGNNSEAQQFLWPSVTAPGVQVTGKTPTYSSNFSAVVGRRFGFVRGEFTAPTYNPWLELHVVELATGRPIRVARAAEDGTPESQSELRVLSDDRVIFFAVRNYPSPARELRVMGAEGSQFACTVDAPGFQPWRARIVADRWIGIDAKSIDAFVVPGLDPL